MGLIRKFATSLLNDDRLKIEKRNDNAVPEFLHFNKERHMPIAELFGKRGSMMYSSMQSFDKFKASKKQDFDKFEENGVGVPFLHIQTILFKVGATLIKEELFYQIFIYEVLPRDAVPPYGDVKIIAENKGVKLYKRLYCDIYKDSRWNRTQFKMVFVDDPNNPCYMVNYQSFRDMDTQIMGQNFRWHVKFNPLMENDHYKLALLNPNEECLLDSPEIKAMKKKKNVSKIEKYEAVIGHYSSEDSDILPGLIEKAADFTIGEIGSVDSFGINNVPRITKIFACQSLLIHTLERHKQRKKRTGFDNNNATLFRTGMFK